MAHSTGLTGYAAAGNGGFDIDLAKGVGRNQRLTDDELKGIESEVIIDVTAVDGDGTGAVGDEVDTCYGGLSAACSVEIGALGLISCQYSSSSFISGPKLRASVLRGCAPGLRILSGA